MGISNETEVAMNDIDEGMLFKKRRLDLAFQSSLTTLVVK